MTASERAEQIWPLLTLCATQRQILSYDLLSKSIGVPRPGLGQLLEPIQSFCILKGLPPLTCIVVSGKSGLPGKGFIAAKDVPRAQAETFAFDWLSYSVPKIEDLEKALKRLPSNGRSLDEMMAESKSMDLDRQL